MIKRLLLLSFLFGTLFASTINQVIISGSFTTEKPNIFNMLKSKPGTAMVTENVIDDIRRVYETGLFKDDITVEPVFLKNGSVDLVFMVTENPRITSVQFMGLHTFTAKQLLASMDLRENAVLDYSKLRGDIRAINDYYHEKGYVLMTIKQVIEPKEAGALIFVINEGIIEDIFIKGLTYTKDFVITREMDSQAGKAFNINVLKEDMRSIFNTGFVDNINIEPPVAGIDPEKVIAVVSVQEKRSGSFQFGGGIGSTSGFFGFLQLEFVNFLGEGYNLAVKGQWGEKQTNYEVRYFNPWFYPEIFGSRAWTTFRLWHTDGQIDEGQGLKAYNDGGEWTLGRKLDKTLSVFGNIRINNISSYESIPIPQKVPTEEISSYKVRSIGAGGNYDTRDNRFNPSSGEFLSARADTSLLFLGASVEYLKTKFQAQKFFPLSDNFALGFKGQADASIGTIFDTERYFLGGSTTIRGYEDGTPIGVGGARVMGTTELRYMINETINIYGFFDIGKIGRGFSQCMVNAAGSPEWRYGYGMGFKVITPIGPLRFDFAWGDGENYGGFESYSLKQSGQMTVHFNIENTF
ncbi:MAG: BamA/TamA family outer membrane protein [Candidatus Margulisbacteria bacterium]|nr:BamA/TamA family outer membrane protein [Candidatus Margulisiibacteriota bacterium]